MIAEQCLKRERAGEAAFCQYPLIKKGIVLLFLSLFLSAVVLVSGFADGGGISWTEEELAFMQAHPVIQLGVDPAFTPFEFIDKDGEHRGISADYLSIIREKTGLRFEVRKGLTWPEAYEKALAGELDAMPAISLTEDRAEHFLFSMPYYFSKRVIVIRDSEMGISGISNLDRMTVAVQRNSSHHSYLLAYPKINLSLYDSAEEALTAVANGSERAYIGNLATSNYLIVTNALTNLKFIAFENENQQALYFAARKDWPELISIVDKALDTITEEEKLAINSKWIDLESDIDMDRIMRAIAVAGAFAAVILAVSIFWNVRLRKEVREREKAQASLEIAKKAADEANEFKSSFLARMSHEIRTPLNAITGMAHLLKKTDISPTQNMYISRITQASGNMLNIINDILDFSKIEAGKVDLEITSFNIGQVIQEVVNIISYRIDEQGIALKIITDPNLPGWFFGDPKRIEQILLNVLNNAVKFTTEGEVSLEIGLEEKKSDQVHLVFTVKDTGIGMTEEQVNKLFLPFIQGDSSINRRFGGSGLGLSIVKNLLDLMGGRIRVSSVPGQGSCFVIHLFLNVDTEKEEKSVETLTAGRLEGIKTLVLEKAVADISLTGSYLNAFGIRCELANSQTKAMDMLETAMDKSGKAYDLLILDDNAPSEGGFRFTASIRDNAKIASKPKIIMILPMMRDDLFEKLKEFGVDGGIERPFIPSMLLNVILDIFKAGTTPAAKPDKGSVSAAPNPDKAFMVLLAEDNKTNQLIVKTLLQQSGIDSILADNGKAALDLFEKHRGSIDLILMDLHMPVMNGYEASAEIRKISTDVPIIAMTADVIMGVQDKCEQSGIHHYISKPFDPDFFIRTVRGILESQRNGAANGSRVLDVSAGLRNLGGDADIYRQVLLEYYDENLNTGDMLSLAVLEKRYTDAERIVHKVKGSSGSIGADAVFRISIKLQNALHDLSVEEIPALENKFLDLLKRLLGEIVEYRDIRYLERDDPLKEDEECSPKF